MQPIELKDLSTFIYTAPYTVQVLDEVWRDDGNDGSNPDWLTEYVAKHPTQKTAVEDFWKKVTDLQKNPPMYEGTVLLLDAEGKVIKSETIKHAY